jgi:hypothetical protein
VQFFPLLAIISTPMPAGSGSRRRNAIAVSPVMILDLSTLGPSLAAISGQSAFDLRSAQHWMTVI